VVVLSFLGRFLIPGFQAALTYYLWRRSVHDTGLRGRARTAATVALIVLMLLVPLTVMAMRLGDGEISTRMAWIAFPWLGVAALACVLFAIRDLARLAVRGARAAARRPAPPQSPERRLFLARVTGGAVATAAVGAAAVGARNALGAHDVTTVEIPLAKLPPALDGFTIAQLSDIHIGMTIGRGFVEEVVAVTNAIGADVIVLTGDIVDGPVGYVADRAEPLRELRAPHGVFAVTGNHEYYSNADAWLPVLARLGLRFLRNERVPMTRAGATFDLVGIDDWTASGHPGHGADLAGALDGRDPARATVLLAHQPRQVHDAVDHGIDLQLSGHTHGGQIWPWHYAARIQQGGFLAGLEKVGDTWLWTSRGVGYWGPPVRLGAQAQIVKIVLRAGTGEPTIS
jgi:predicted MPP superfamily phosphohydrolase